ncbi:MAG: ferritin family protein, partial [Candidatus Heimdallarchaeota archaeon]
GAKEYRDMAKRTNNKEFAKLYTEMAKDEERHLKILEKILKQEPCEEQNIIRRRRNIRKAAGLGRNRRY